MDEFTSLTNHVKGLRDDVDGWKEVSRQAIEYGSREDLALALEGSLAILDATLDLATNIIAEIMVAKMKAQGLEVSSSDFRSQGLDT